METEFYNYKSANWNKYRNILCEKLELVPNLKNIADIDKNVDRLTSVITGAADLAIPKSRTGKLHINIPRHIKLLKKNIGMHCAKSVKEPVVVISKKSITN